MSSSSLGKLVEKRHEQLAAKYSLHWDTVFTAWNCFDAAQRKKCVVAAAADGKILEHSSDESHGDACKILPEWNIHDLTADPEFLLDILQVRADYPPADLVKAGLNGAPGDRDLIEEAMENKGLRNKESYVDGSYCLLADDESYGKAIVLPKNMKKGENMLAMAQMVGFCVPQAMGDLILKRQLDLLDHLNGIVDIIAKEYAKDPKKWKPAPVEPSWGEGKLTVLNSQTVNGITVQTIGDPDCEEDRAMPLPLISFTPTRTTLGDKITISDMIGLARDQACAREEYLYLFSERPHCDIFPHAVEEMFESLPQRVPDEKGRTPAVRKEKDLSGAVFDAAQHAFKGAVIWCYIRLLLDVVNESSTDKAYRGILLQELTNVCHLEYARLQGFLKRHVQTGTGEKWFKRISNVQNKDGSPRVNLKGKPEKLVPSDIHLQYVLRLCQPETNAAKAVDWMEKLAKMHKEHPVERNMLDGIEAESLSELAFVIAFIRDLALVVSLPPVSHKTGQTFISRLTELDAELNTIKKKVDRSIFVTSVGYLTDPGVPEVVLKSLDEDYIVKYAGSEMGHLYHDLLGASYSDLQTQRQAKKDKTEWVQSTSSLQSPEERIEERRQKERTRLKHSKYHIAPHVETDPSDGMQTPEPAAAPRHVVPMQFGRALSAIFDKSESAGEVKWTDFVMAMQRMGFGKRVNFNSVYTFYPPEGMASETPLTVHQPHEACFGEASIPVLARRLSKAYGWSEVTFPSLHQSNFDYDYGCGSECGCGDCEYASGDDHEDDSRCGSDCACEYCFYCEHESVNESDYDDDQIGWLDSY